MKDLNGQRTPDKDCPQCGLLNPGSARRCDCGWDFRTGSVDNAHRTTAVEHRSRVRMSALVGFAVGIGGSTTIAIVQGRETIFHYLPMVVHGSGDAAAAALGASALGFVGAAVGVYLAKHKGRYDEGS